MSDTMNSRKCSGENISLPEKSFECSYCGKKASNRSHILEHERIHTGEKPFSCQYCDRKFTTNSAKTLHERTRHNAEKPFSCEYCDKKFASKSQKTSHERTHMEKLKIEIDDIKNEFPGGTVMESADSRSIEIGEGSQSNLPISNDEIKEIGLGPHVNRQIVGLLAQINKKMM